MYITALPSPKRFNCYSHPTMGQDQELPASWCGYIKYVESTTCRVESQDSSQGQGFNMILDVFPQLLNPNNEG